MSDVRTRALERKWKETEVLEDEATLLLAKMREGKISREDVEAAALFGHSAALSLLEMDYCSLDERIKNANDHEIETFIQTLYGLGGKELLVRFGLPMVHHILRSRFDGPKKRCLFDSPLLCYVEDWLFADAYGKKKDEEQIQKYYEELASYYLIPGQPLLNYRSKWLCALELFQVVISDQRSLSSLVTAYVHFYEGSMERIQGEVLPWLLNRREDPVRKRVEKRGIITWQKWVSDKVAEVF